MVILSFMDPIALMNGQNSGGYTNGVPNGMISSYSYFTSKGIRVVFSIGGASWSNRFVTALNQNAAQFARNAAAAAKKYDVGIEIDVEVDSNSYANQLNTFVDTYRSVIPYESSPNASSASILTIDVGSATDYLGAIAAQARGWVAANKINWLNAMVSDKPWTNINSASKDWQTHISAGLPANRLVVSHFGSNTCHTYAGILEDTVTWVQTKNARGISFWAAGSGGGEFVSNCQGMQQGSKAYLNQ
jgi:homoserine dehydrogenase